MFALTLLAPACSDETDVPLARVVEHGDGVRREIALTFDAGTGGSTDPEGMAEILRVLREHKLRATFSLTGLWAEANRDLLFTIAADGHQIINGTYSGEPWAGLSTSERKLSLTRTEVTVYRYTSRSTIPFFRPPGGRIDDSVRRDAAENGYDTIVLPPISLDADVLRGAEPGAIIELGISQMEAGALDELITDLREKGYALATIDALLAP